LIASIEDAARKRKIRVRSINDFTAAQVEILVTLSPGEDPDKAISALYHFSLCEVTIHSNLIVIQGERPVQMDIDQVIRFNAEQLVDLLKRELEFRQREREQDLHRRTLVQIFIEHRLYKQIEDCDTYELVQQTVLKSLAPFRRQLARDITMDDVEMLLSLQIKRISRFDLKANEEEKLKTIQQLKEIRGHLKKLKSYAINYLEGLIERYGKQYKRKTRLTTAEEIDVRELTASELGIVYDRERGFLGYDIKGETAFRCSPLDKLLIVWETGRYQMIAPPDRLFVDKNVAHFGIYEREKVFTIVYNTDKAAFLKRFVFGGAIMNRDYSCTQEGAKIKYISDRTSKQLLLKYRHIKGARIGEQTFDLNAFAVRGPKSRGIQVAKRTVTSVSERAGAARLTNDR
jgi:topoisomerase-4 subunit A